MATKTGTVTSVTEAAFQASDPSKSSPGNSSEDFCGAAMALCMSREAPLHCGTSSCFFEIPRGANLSLSFLQRVGWRLWTGSVIKSSPP